MHLSRAQARALDRRAIEDFGVPGVVLMENAGRGIAELMLRLGVHGPVVVCCGRGNNGGDGLVIARHLDNAGVSVRVLLFAEPDEVTGDAAINYRILARSGPPILLMPPSKFEWEVLQKELAVADWIVDALFGTGLSSPLRPPFDRVVEAVNVTSARLMAVDIPSGLDCDTGEPLGPTIRAHHTATVAALKAGFMQPAAQPWLGQVHVIDMGMPRRILQT
jgi:NAD(P)H-hydrate epimerase